MWRALQLRAAGDASGVGAFGVELEYRVGAALQGDTGLLLGPAQDLVEAGLVGDVGAGAGLRIWGRSRKNSPLWRVAGGVGGGLY